MINLKSIIGKYDLTVQDLEECVRKAEKTVRKIYGKNNDNDLLQKFLEDSFEELGISYRDIPKLVEYYSYYQETNTKKEKLLNELNSGKEPRDIAEEEISNEEIEEEESMQTSTSISNTLGMARKPPKDFKVTTL